jgi:predicted dehydrogenase
MTAVAVIGAGHWGKNLVRNFAQLPDADLRYVCDLDPDIRGRMAALYPAARVTGSFAEVLADDAVEAVVIATAAPTHYPLARRALAAGRHTFVEKPLTLGVADAAKLERLAAEVDRKLMVGHLMEYHGAVNYMKELMDGGEIGDPLYLYLQRVNLGVVRTDENA